MTPAVHSYRSHYFTFMNSYYEVPFHFVVTLQKKFDVIARKVKAIDRRAKMTG